MATAIETTATAGQVGPGLDDFEHYEVVNGQRVELPPMGAYEVLIASLLDQALGGFAMPRRLGLSVTEMLFALGEDLPNRRPDVAFVSAERWPLNRRVPSVSAWPVVPDLAVEVVSPTNMAEELVLKVDEYFAAGVRLVWVIYPNAGLVYVYRSPTEIRVLRRDGELDGGEVLPGFRMPLPTLFQDDAEGA